MDRTPKDLGKRDRGAFEQRYIMAEGQEKEGRRRSRSGKKRWRRRRRRSTRRMWGRRRSVKRGTKS